MSKARKLVWMGEWEAVAEEAAEVEVVVAEEAVEEEEAEMVVVAEEVE